MQLTLVRADRQPGYTVGSLFINGEFFCYTLEDTDRYLTQDMSLDEIKSKKVYGKTAIPKGIYTVDMNTVSPKFKDREWAKPYDGKLPRLVGVPGYEGVLIHVGNTAEDTLGCILVGANHFNGKLTNSTVIFHRLMTMLTNSKELITITIQ